MLHRKLSSTSGEPPFSSMNFIRFSVALSSRSEMLISPAFFFFTLDPSLDARTLREAKGPRRGFSQAFTHGQGGPPAIHSPLRLANEQRPLSMSLAAVAGDQLANPLVDGPEVVDSGDVRDAGKDAEVAHVAGGGVHRGAGGCPWASSQNAGASYKTRTLHIVKNAWHSKTY